MLSETDKYLVEKVRAGDYKAFETLYKIYYGYLYQVAKTYLKSEEEAQDLVQDLFVKIWEQPEILSVKTSLKGYLHKSIYNSTINYILRKQQKTTRLNEASVTELKRILIATESDLPETGLLSSEMDMAIKKTVEQLPEECRKIFLLSREEEMPHKEIAKRLNISENTIKVQIYRALIKLKVALKEYR